MSELDAREILTVREVARYLRADVSTVYRLAKRRELPAFRIGTEWRFTRKSIEQWSLDASALTISKAAADNNSAPK